MRKEPSRLRLTLCDPAVLPGQVLIHAATFMIFIRKERISGQLPLFLAALTISQGPLSEKTPTLTDSSVLISRIVGPAEEPS
jgi:hypothetical protein